jgi:hypothetical protein
MTNPNEWPSHKWALAAHEWAENTMGDDGTWEDAHSPLPRGFGDETIRLPHDLHQIHGIKQSEDFGRRCFYAFHALNFLKNGAFVEGWFELYDLYQKWAGQSEETRLKLFGPRKTNGCEGRVQSVESKIKLRKTWDEKFKSGYQHPAKGRPRPATSLANVKRGQTIAARKKLRQMSMNDPLAGGFWD